MFRIFWFVVCLILSVFLAWAFQSVIPVLSSSISSGGISHGIYDLLSRSGYIQVASGLAIFGFFATILALGGQVLQDGIAMRRLHLDLSARSETTTHESPIKGTDLLKLAAETGDLETPCENYVFSMSGGTDQTLEVSLPAERFFGQDLQVESRLHLWFFNHLHWFLIGCGTILLLLSMVTGIDDVLFRSMLTSQQPIGGLLTPLQTGLFALVITLMAAVTVRVLVRFLVGLRRVQTVRFNTLLDSLFLSQNDGGSAKALHQPLKTLSEAQALIAEDRTEQIAKVMDEALKKLTKTLTGEFQSQVKSTTKLLEETEKQVTKSTVAVQEAHETLAKYARGQSGAIDKAIGSALKSHLKEEENARSVMAQAVADTIKVLEKGLLESSNASASAIETSLAALNENYGGGLTETATHLKQTQLEIARLVSAVESFAGQPLDTATTSPAHDEYLRLVGQNDEAPEPVNLAAAPLEEASDENAERVGRLTKALKLGGGRKTKPKKATSDERLSSALKSLKKESQPNDLPEL